MEAGPEILLRTADDADLPALADITRRCWRGNYGDVIPADAMARLLADDGGERWRQYRDRWGGERWVAVRGDTPVGYVTAGPPRDDDASPGDAEVYALFVAPEEQGRGTGRLLLEHAIGHLASAGHEQVYLWVIAAASGPRAFYASCGFTHDGDARPFGAWDIETVRYRCPLGYTRPVSG